jgi:ATP-dependent protease HslVU (ClpYQ) peptidase subunit
MTTIIAVETTHGVEIGCDSQATGSDKIQMEQSKVFANNGAIYGVAGMALLANEMRYGDLPKPPKTPQDTDRWMTREMVPALRAIIDEISPKRPEDDYEMHILVVANDRAYEIGANAGWVRNTEGVYAIGSGGPYAAGAISAGASVAQALQIAAKHDPYTGYQLTTTTAARMLA